MTARFTRTLNCPNLDICQKMLTHRLRVLTLVQSQLELLIVIYITSSVVWGFFLITIGKYLLSHDFSICGVYHTSGKTCCSTNSLHKARERNWYRFGSKPGDNYPDVPSGCGRKAVPFEPAVIWLYLLPGTFVVFLCSGPARSGKSLFTPHWLYCTAGFKPCLRGFVFALAILMSTECGRIGKWQNGGFLNRFWSRINGLSVSKWLDSCFYLCEHFEWLSSICRLCG